MCVSLAMMTHLDFVVKIVQVFTYATMKISTNKIPLIHEVIPHIDVITSTLDEFMDDGTKHPAVWHAALRGLLMLNKYYTLTDESIVFRIAMSKPSFLFQYMILMSVQVLHPTKKTTYFTKAGWPTSWIDEAKLIITKEWIDNYKPKAAPAPSVVDPVDDDNDNLVK